MSAAPGISDTPSTYRALILRPDGVVTDVQRLLAADDDEAIALAQSMGNGHAVELWDGLRFIEHYAPVGAQDSDSS